MPGIEVLTYRVLDSGADYDEYWREEDGVAQQVRTETDGEGGFSFGAMPAGAYYLCFDGVEDGFAFSCRTEEFLADPVVVAGGAETVVTHELDLGATIRGAVTGDGGESLSGYIRARVLGAEGPDQRWGEVVDGRYEIVGVPSGETRVCGIYLEAGGNDFLPACWVSEPEDRSDLGSPLAVPEGEQLSGIDVVAGMAARLDVDVMGPDREPVTGALVTVARGDGSYLSEWTADGRYDEEPGSSTFRYLPSGLVTVCVEYPFDDAAYASECYDDQPFVSPDDAAEGTPVTLTPGHRTSLTIELTRLASPTRTATVAGLIQKPMSPEALVVRMHDTDGEIVASTEADEQGRWEITGLVTGDYVVCFTDGPGLVADECYEDRPFAEDGSTGDPVRVAAGTFTYLETEMSGSEVDIVGQVLGDGQGVEGVSVVLYDEHPRRALSIQRTDDEGRYEFAGVDGLEQYAVCFEASATGYASQCGLGQPYVKDGQGIERGPIATLASTTNLEPTDHDSGAVSGRVVDADQSPVDGYVYVLDSSTGLQDSFTVRTAVDGSYIVGDIDAGTYHVCVDTNLRDLPEGETGFAPECLDDTPNLFVSRGVGPAIDIDASRHEHVDFELGAGVAITIEAVDESGAPVSTYYSIGWDREVGGARVETQEYNGFLRSGPGIGRLTDLPAGDYYVCAGDGRWYIEDSQHDDACFEDAAAPPPYYWVTNGGTTAAEAAGATLVHLEPGEEAVVRIILPTRVPDDDTSDFARGMGAR